jgi:hypothetical protein
MAELTIRPDEIRDALQRFVQSYEPDATRAEEVGTVTYSGDGIARVGGLPSAMANELLEFEDGTLGMAQNLEIGEIGVVVLGDFTGIEEGQKVRRTGKLLSVPVSDNFLGRVVDPLGNPIDGKGEIESTERRELVMDACTADIAWATGNANIPRPSGSWPRIRTYLPRWQALRIKDAGAFERLQDINPYRMYPEVLAADPARYVFLFDAGEGHRLILS